MQALEQRFMQCFEHSAASCATPTEQLLAHKRQRISYASCATVNQCTTCDHAVNTTAASHPTHVYMLGALKEQFPTAGL